ncbi:MAG: hypothetical protein ATN35_00455 [Epulopiscium sp. Nele67-Bin004]|nr:MAG: hypothetical protein ATN35_00455 [Epulopiscium sp. Nele67-Bin004]
MWNSWVVVFQAQQDGKVYNSAKEILKYLQPHLKEYRGYTCSGFLKKDEFEAGEKVVARFTSLSSEVQGVINMILFRNKVTHTTIDIDNKPFLVTNIDLCNSQYAYQFDETADDDEFSPTCKVRLLSPAFFKVGDMYRAELVEKLLVRNMTAMYKKHTGVSIDKSLLSIEVVEQYKVRTDGKEMVKGEFIVRDIGVEVYKLMQFIQFFGIGYKTEEGYGAVQVEGVD